MKRYPTLFCALALCACCLFSCTGKTYKNDIEPAHLTKSVKTALPLPDGYAEHGEDYLAFRFEGIGEHIDGYSIIYSADTRRADLVAVFHVKSASDAQKVEDICKDFIEDQRALFSVIVEQYLPSEAERLDGAQVRGIGNYVIVSVLSPSDTEKAFSEIEKALS